MLAPHTRPHMLSPAACALDPGMVDTRAADFEQALSASLSGGGGLPGGDYCRTSLVRKPLR